ncbi:replication initiator protein A [Lactobacillus sp. ESL0681]|uniref:replication initiator protein A n=1 Tax=Lactobacillus sp. ESL0681 TaxID=2983211 RepID=UPI0023F9DB94|nr:replication initiator protein A [Lactobacillus sp. ESL0681]WEV41301.1 replication initiator protein A [Lactobacillus sp. ESL0681]
MEKKNSKFKFYDADQVYANVFGKFPMVLLHDPKYKSELSSDAKIAYMVLKDRLEYSIRNRWIDEENHIYFIYTNQELKELFGWSDSIVRRVKHELEDIGLLYQKRMGYNPKTGRNEPNRLYLAELDVQAKDIYLKPKFAEKDTSILERSGLFKNDDPQETVKSQRPHGLYENDDPRNFVDKGQQALEQSGLFSNAVYLDKDIKDTIQIQEDTDTDEWDFTSKNYSQEQVEEQNQDLINHMQDFLCSSTANGLQLDFFLSKEAMERICSYARTPQVANQIISTILLAKNNADKNFRKDCAEWGIDTTGVGIVFENIDSVTDSQLKDDVSLAIRRFFNRIRSYEYDNSKQIKNVRGYLYKTMYNLFTQNLNNQLEAREAEKHLPDNNSDSADSDSDLPI